MLINIANTPKYKFIEEETIRISKELGFKQETNNRTNAIKYNGCWIQI